MGQGSRIHVDVGEDPVRNQFNQHLRVYGGFLILITGNPYTKMGVGKTMSALTLGCAIDPYFVISKLQTSVSGFLNEIEKVRVSNRPKQVVILDEGQTSVPSTEWYAVSNKAIFYTLSVFRNKRSIAVIITPDFDFIDKRIRRLVSYWAYPDIIEIGGHGPAHQACVLRIEQLNKPPFQNQIYYNSLRVQDDVLGIPGRVKYLLVDLPPQELIDAYQIKDAEVKRQIGEEAREAAVGYEKASKKQTVQVMVDKYMEHPEVQAEYSARKKVSQLTLMALNESLNRTDALILAGLINRKKRLLDGRSDNAS